MRMRLKGYPHVLTMRFHPFISVGRGLDSCRSSLCIISGMRISVYANSAKAMQAGLRLIPLTQCTITLKCGSFVTRCHM